MKNNWKIVKLGEVTTLVRGPFGGSLKKSIFVKEGYPVYEQSHAIYNQFTDIRYFINKSKYEEMKRFTIAPGNLIMSCSGTMGKVAIAPSDIKVGIINQALLLIKPKKELLNTYLKYYMESRSFKDTLALHTMGAAIKNVASVKVLKQIEIPLPDIAEQVRIVEKLDTLFSDTFDMKKLISIKSKKLDELNVSILNKAFSGEL